jgi:alcohol dehydrogenase
MEHALSAHHPELPHGAGLIMLSESYFSYFGEVCPEKLSAMAKVMNEEASPKGFIKALKKLQKACGVDNLKMSDYGITREELPKLAKNGHDTMAGLYTMDRKTLTVKDSQSIMEKAYQ